MKPDKAYNTHTDKIVFSSDVPDIQYLNSELNRSLFYGGNMSRLTTSDDQRMCRWDGQSSDGKKHQEQLGYEPFPYEGASDVRNRLIDNTINQLVHLLMTSFQRATLRVTGTEANDGQQAAAAQTLMQHILGCKIRAEVEREAELWIQYTLQFGWGALHIGWDRKISTRPDTISMEEIAIAAQMQGAGQMAKAIDSIKNNPESDLGVDLIESALLCTRKEAKRICKQLFETGVADYMLPYIQKNLPTIAALKPFDEIAFPPETVNLQEARVVFRRIFMNEVQFRNTALSDSWNQDFVEEATQTAGKSGFLHDSNLIPLIAESPNAMEKNDNLIEVVYSYARQIDEQGKAAIYYTVFCPMVQNTVYGKHEILPYAHGEYPFVEFRRERLRRSIVESRGIPEILFTDQEELKAQHDATRDRTALEVNPPITVTRRIGIQNRIGPGQLLPVNSPTDYGYLAAPTGTPATAFALMERIEMKTASMFGLYHPQVLPVHTQMTQQFIVNNFFTAFSGAYKQMFALCVQYLLPEEIERITSVPIRVSEDELMHMYDFSVKFDVREHDTDYVLEKLKAINQFVLPMDTAGAIDRNKLIRRLVEAIAPETARDILIDQQTATQRQYKEVQNDLAMMMLGLEAQYTENDPQANAKMQAMQDIMSKNPKAQNMSQSDGMFQALLTNYQKNLQMSIMQQQNAQIGRTGVSPVGDEFAMSQKTGQPIEADPEAQIPGLEQPMQQQM